jgi:hypothetical protein
LTTQRYEFRDPAEPGNFGRLLDQVSAFASIASFVVDGNASRYSSWAHALVDEIKSELVETESITDRWPGTLKLTASHATRYLFRLTPATSTLLQQAATSLFDWHNPRLPEDLHFLRADHSLLLGNIALEEYAWMELSAEEHESWNELPLFPLNGGTASV